MYLNKAFLEIIFKVFFINYLDNPRYQSTRATLGMRADCRKKKKSRIEFLIDYFTWKRNIIKLRIHIIFGLKVHPITTSISHTREENARLQTGKLF